MTRRDKKWVEVYNHKVSKEAYIKQLGINADFSIEKTDNNVAIITFGERFGKTSTLERIIKDEDCRTPEDALRRSIDYCIFTGYQNIVLDFRSNGIKTEIISRLVLCRDKLKNYLGDLKIVAPDKSKIRVVLELLFGDTWSFNLYLSKEKAVESYQDSVIATVLRYCGSMKQHLTRAEWNEIYGDNERHLDKKDKPIIEGEDITAYITDTKENNRRDAIKNLQQIIHHLNYPLKEVRVWALETLTYIFLQTKPANIVNYKRIYNIMAKIAKDSLALTEWKLGDPTVVQEVAEFQRAVVTYNLRVNRT